MTEPWDVSLEETQRWIGILHRRTCRDAVQISELFQRIAWLSQPWWKRLLRTPPWFSQS